MTKVESPLGQLMQKRVTRKEFLALSGSALVTIMGLSSIIHFLSGKQVGIKYLYKETPRGFGSGFYGR